MANNINFGYRVSRTLTYTVFQPDGSARGAVDISLPETEVGVSGYYTATHATIQALDFVIVKDSVAGVVMGQGQFSPDVTSVSIDVDLGDIVTDIGALEDKIDLVSVALNKVKNVYPLPPEPVRPIVSVSG